eukprot:GILI01029511.1.p1 GENE.GILI01029511.1~~GILI01029511.1.p1  ORF type:complete len:287 (+),score=59.89 GILI01029511.1:64-924(+)
MSARRSSPLTRRRYNPDYHQMGDHTLFHNGATARMFPALGKMSNQQLSEMFAVPEVDRTSERLAEVRFAEQYNDRRMSFRTYDAPVRDEQQNKIIAKGGIVSSTFSNGSRPPTASNTLQSSGKPKTASNYNSRPPTAGGITTDEGLYFTNTIQLHGNKQFKIQTETSAKDALANTIPSLCIGFDVDETLHTDTVRRAKEARAKQTRISSPIKRGTDTTAPPQLYKPFTVGAETNAKRRLENQWYLNSGDNALAACLQQVREKNKIERENGRVARQRYTSSPSRSPR